MPLHLEQRTMKENSDSSLLKADYFLIKWLFSCSLSLITVCRNINDRITHKHILYYLNSFSILWYHLFHSAFIHSFCFVISLHATQIHYLVFFHRSICSLLQFGPNHSPGWKINNMPFKAPVPGQSTCCYKLFLSPVFLSLSAVSTSQDYDSVVINTPLWK